MEQELNETYLTVQEAAQYADRSTLTIHRWVKSKRIEAIQHVLTRRWWIPKNALEKVLQEYKSNQ